MDAHLSTHTSGHKTEGGSGISYEYKRLMGVSDYVRMQGENEGTVNISALPVCCQWCMLV